MSEVNLSGSCLCGTVCYEIVGDAQGFWHCHCQRCQKASGTGHASNIIMKPDTVRWTAGEEHICRYKLPEARRFATAFCDVCGSPLPRIAPDNSLAVVPAGSLDVDPGFRPQGRIHDGSRAPWSCAGDDLPCHDTYPG